MQKILIVKPSALGDVVQATSILPVIKARYPRSRLSWFVFKQNAGVLRGNPWIDDLIVMDRKGVNLSRICSLVRELRGRKFDLVVDLQCLLRSALVTFSTGSRRRVGYSNGREFSSLFYNEAYEISRDMHAVDGYLLMCRMLGCRDTGKVRFVLPGGDSDRARVESLMPPLNGEGPLVTVCPTAGWSSKTWPVEHFARVGDLLADEYGARIVWLGAPGEEPQVKRASDLMKHDSLNLVGRLSLAEVAVLLRRADLFVGNDSGLMHMAAAAGIRTAVVFGPTDPRRTGPYSERSRVVTANVDCRPCFKKTCSRPRCLTDILPEALMNACRDLLSR